MTFTLTCLGTDTRYQDVLNNPEDYPLGETLSLASTLVNPGQLMGQIDDVQHICGEHITLINGPTTLGKEVFDRINLGVNILLKAIANGKIDLQLVAHSRGACQSILMAHELDRIQKLFADESKDLAQIKIDLAKTIGNGVYLNVDEIFLTTYFPQLKTNFSQVRLGMFLLDPVPGGGFFSLPGLKWEHPLFYSLPDIVNYYEQYIFENERTRCFKSVAPQENQTRCNRQLTNFIISSLPGHHGTGSGNPYDQAKLFKTNPGYDIQKTLGVQKLIFAKLMAFLKKGNHRFTLNRAEDHTRTLIDIAATVIDRDEQNYETLVLLQKQQILENLEHYLKFNQTSYPYLTQEQSLQRLFFTIPENSRIIHWGSSDDYQLDSILNMKRTSQFLDVEHMSLYLKVYAQINFDLTQPIQCLTLINQQIEHPAPHIASISNELVDLIISYLCELYLADYFDYLNIENPAELLRLLKAILDTRVLPQDVMSMSQADLMVSPIERINEALKSKIGALEVLRTNDLENQFSQDLAILNNLENLPDGLNVCIADFRVNKMVDGEQLKTLMHLNQYLNILEMLQSWTSEGIKARFKIMCADYSKSLSMDRHIQSLNTGENKHIDEEVIEKLTLLKLNFKSYLTDFFKSKHWSLHELYQIVDAQTFAQLSSAILQDNEELISFYDSWQAELQYLTKHYEANLKARETSAKLGIVRNLSAILTDQKPSYINIHAFYHQLSLCEPELSAHRDLAWKRFLMTSLNLFFWGSLISGAIFLGISGHLIAGIALGSMTFISLSATVYDRYLSYACFNLFSSNGQVYTEQVDSLKSSNEFKVTSFLGGFD